MNSSSFLLGMDNPILQREAISTLRTCRQLISEEFGIKLSFAQPDLVKQIVAFGNRSDDPVLQKHVAVLQARI